MPGLLEKLKSPPAKQLSPLMARLSGQTVDTKPQEPDTSSQDRVKEALLKDEDFIYSLMTAVVDEVGKVKQGIPGENGQDGKTPTEEEIRAIAEPIIQGLIPVIAQKAATMIRVPEDGKPGKSIRGERGPAPIPGKHYYSKAQVEELVKKAVADLPQPTLGAVVKEPDLSELATKEEIERLKREVARLHGTKTRKGGGGASATILTATETPNGVRTTFTFSSQPTELVTDGVSHLVNDGWTWSNPTATLTVPPQSTIYGRS